MGNPFTFVLPLNKLQVLRLDLNNFRGTISSNIGQLSQLSELWLDGTAMYGTLPTQLFDLLSMNTLKLNEANFSGSLSSEIGRLNQTLQVLDVGNNDMTGSLPVAALDSCKQLGASSLADFSDLSTLLISHNPFICIVFRNPAFVWEPILWSICLQ